MNTSLDAVTSLTSGHADAVTVTVALPDGSTAPRALAVHPLARLIPLITTADLDRLTDDITAHGVNEPIVLFGGQVLDGRNRLAVCSVTGTPVPVRDFDGDETAARAYVWSANAARRHLSTPQLALAATRFGFIADAKATAPRPPAPRPGTHPAAPWAKIAARKLGGALTPQTLERFDQAKVADAPDTVARIESGEIRRIDIAVKEATLERSAAEGRIITPPPPVPRTPWDRLGCALGDVRAAERALASGEPSAMTGQQFTARAQDIQAALIRIRDLYRENRLTPSRFAESGPPR